MLSFIFQALIEKKKSNLAHHVLSIDRSFWHKVEVYISTHTKEKQFMMNW